MGAVKKIGKKLKKGVKKISTKVVNGATLGVLGEKGVRGLSDYAYKKAIGRKTAKDKAKDKAKAAAAAAAKAAAVKKKADAAKARKDVLDPKRALARQQSAGSNNRNIGKLLSKFKSFDNLPSATQQKFERSLVGRATVSSNEDLQSLLRTGISNPLALERNASKEATVAPAPAPAAQTPSIAKPNVDALRGKPKSRGRGKFGLLGGRLKQKRTVSTVTPRSIGKRGLLGSLSRKITSTKRKPTKLASLRGGKGALFGRAR